MTDTFRKKLIEVSLPLEAINAASAREKSIRHGHPSTLHLWWARRPLAACRAVLFAQLVDDPSAWPDKFPTEEEQEEERARLHRIIEYLVKWENTTNERVLDAAKREIARSVAWNRGEEPPVEPEAVAQYLLDHAPPVYDPFCGGGSIPLEAQRLGLRAYGSDLNPVAVMISKALVEFPPKFAGLPPVNPEAQKKLREGGSWSSKGAQGLAEDVRYYGQWMRDEAEKRIGHLYPKVDLPSEYGGGKATVIAWLWARTVASPNPACKGAHVPLVRSFDLSTKKGKRAWVEPIVDQSNNSYRFEIRTGQGEAREGTVVRGQARCLISGESVPLSYVRKEAQSGRLGVRMMAIVAEGRRRRIYLPPTTQMVNIAESAQPKWAPDEFVTTPSHDVDRLPMYGMKTWGEAFTKRQLAALTTLVELVAEAREQILIDASAAGRSSDTTALADGGAGATAYSDAVSVYLAFAVDKVANLGSTICSWMSDRGAFRETFARQAIPMVWDFAEANPFSGVGGNFSTPIEKISKSIEFAPAGQEGTIFQADATSSNLDQCTLISVDPPYYDNIGYADLSDYFYVWLRRSLRSIFPKLFGTMLVPKTEELVATPDRHGGREKAEAFFLDGMTRAMQRMAVRSDENYPAAIYYAFKQTEVAEEGIASTGWATFLDAVIKSGYSVDGTWPVRTEGSGRIVARGTNALASSIVLICRKRLENAATATRSEFLRALKSELPGALKLLQEGSIAPVDMAQASIGPGMAIFTRYARVLESDDRPMTVKTALQLINQALDEYLSEQEGDYDADTRFAITWFDSYGMDTEAFGSAETLAKARNVSVQGVVAAGIFEARGNKARLLQREELWDEWTPAIDDRLTVWECTQYLIRRLEGEGGEAAAATLLNDIAAVPGRGFPVEAVKDLAYRLYGICERKKWANEATAYNGLVVAWPELTKLAAQMAGDTGPAEPQLNLAGDA